MPSIKDIISLSVVLNFTTSDEGWIQIQKGSLLRKPFGEINGRHSALIEGFDFKNGRFICKNSWGGKHSSPRFDIDITLTNFYSFTIVYYTIFSIKGKTSKKYQKNIEQSHQMLFNKQIDAYWADNITAIYDNDYVCEYHPEKDGPKKYLAFNIDQYIIYSIDYSGFLQSYDKYEKKSFNSFLGTLQELIIFYTNWFL